jgi:hypothetical protein
MWKNSSTPDFSVVVADQIHIKHNGTGYIYKVGQFGIHPDLNEPDVFTSGVNGGWSCVLGASHHSSFSRAGAVNLPNETLEDRQRYRRQFGELREIYQLKELNPNSFTPWDETLVNLLVMAIFIRMDLNGYVSGDIAYPDQVDFMRSNLPSGLTRIYTNPCAGVVTP